MVTLPRASLSYEPILFIRSIFLKNIKYIYDIFDVNLVISTRLGERKYDSTVHSTVFLDKRSRHLRGIHVASSAFGGHDRVFAFSDTARPHLHRISKSHDTSAILSNRRRSPWEVHEPGFPLHEKRAC